MKKKRVWDRELKISAVKRERSFNPTLLIAGRDAQDAW